MGRLWLRDRDRWGTQRDREGDQETERRRLRGSDERGQAKDREKQRLR